jgi:hypothetical protein
MATRFEVQTYTLCDGWVNCWTDESEEPLTFATEGEAYLEIAEIVNDEDSGDHEAYTFDDFRVHEVRP